MKAVPEARLREREVVEQIEGDIAKKRQAEGPDHVPDAEKPDLRVRLRDVLGAGPANAARVNDVAEVERRRRAAAESDDVDDVVAGRPVVAQLLVGLVEPRQLTQAKGPAQGRPKDAGTRPDAGDVEVVIPGGRL